jgi:hypothetical protein
LSGTFELTGKTNLQGVLMTDLSGDHVQLHCVPTNVPYGQFLATFDGHAQGDVLSGSLSMNDLNEVPWTGKRDKSDFTGTWEWPGPSGAAVQLKIERREGKLVANYADASREVPITQSGNLPVPISDIYDFGGGIYFTVLLGLQGPTFHSGSPRRVGVEDGWLIGEAVSSNGKLSGTIAFYPYPPMNFGPRGLPAPENTNRPPMLTGPRDWQPRRVSSAR